MSKCIKYSNPYLKVEKLKSLRACLSCGKVGHYSKDCTFDFKFKCHCGKNHFYFLCLNKQKQNFSRSEIENNNNYIKDNSVRPKEKNFALKNKSKKPEKNSHSCLSISGICPKKFSNNSILPTFSGVINNKLIRVLKDTGAQSNFICSEILTEINYKVITDDFSVSINGFNSSAFYKTKIIEIEIEINKEKMKIRTVVIPKIKIDLHIPGLSKLAKKFINCGYKLADRELFNSDKISNINLILGAESAFCIPNHDVPFGKSSIYIESSIGILLIGKVENYYKDFEQLLKLNNSNVNHSFASTLVKVEDTDIIQNFQFINVNNEVECFETSAYFSSFIENDFNIPQKALDEYLVSQFNFHTGYDNYSYDTVTDELNNKLISFVLNNIKRENNGRIRVPILWNNTLKHLLTYNKSLSLAILNSTLKKYKKDKIKLKLIDEVFRKQEKEGIIQRIDLEDFLKRNNFCTFLPHMPVFNLTRTTTKCHVVFLSNFCQKRFNKLTISHNQAIHSGPCLNQKLSTAFINLRFDKYLLIFDLKKAFNQITLSECDANKLLFLWFKDISKNNFEVIGYRNLRLPFGLRCSPTLLMLVMYKILILDAETDSECLKELKKTIYHLIYMDNGSITTNCLSELESNYFSLKNIFSPYGFEIQQLHVNNDKIQSLINKDFPIDSSQLGNVNSIKLFGSKWNLENDLISTDKFSLDIKAKTKRTILSSIASEYDLFNINGPLLNRARLFMHSLQCNNTLGWDQVIDDAKYKEWTNIVKQYNNSCSLQLNRSVGKRDDDYKLIACTDASGCMYGVVVYIFNCITKKCHFLIAKNRIINNCTSFKSVPSLELLGIELGVMTLVDLKEELSGEKCLKPLKINEIQLFSDSCVALRWIFNYAMDASKTRHSIFVKNRLFKISNLCKNFPINFKFISGGDNPSDCITRAFSYNRLLKSSYLTGPSINLIDSVNEGSNFKLPCVEDKVFSFISLDNELKISHLIPLNKYSSFDKLIHVYGFVFKFIYKLNKGKIKFKNDYLNESNFYNSSFRYLLKTEQTLHFSNVLNYLESSRIESKIPELIDKLNIFIDKDLLKVKGKFIKPFSNDFPVLLPKNSELTKLIITSLHNKLGHCGFYRILCELRKRFYIEKIFSTVKLVVKNCVICKKSNATVLKLNQSYFREFRSNPNSIPFSYVFLDYIGPFTVFSNNCKTKVYILILSCLWSRATSLQLCDSLSIDDFIRALQLHYYKWGIPSYLLSDSGSQLVSASSTLNKYLDDEKVINYMNENGMKKFEFTNYVKGRSQLGSLVESMVKITKKLIFSSIRNLIITYKDFFFLIEYITHMINRRPVAFKDSLRQSDVNSVPSPITPEMLLHGRELVSVNIIPQIHDSDDDDLDWIMRDSKVIIQDNYLKLSKAVSKLKKIYQDEFDFNLLSQSTSHQGRYRSVNHKSVSVGDIVILKEDNTKRNYFPMCRVLSVEKILLEKLLVVSCEKVAREKQFLDIVLELFLYCKYLNN